MSHAYVVGQITVKQAERWAEYRAQVVATLLPFGGELLFRGEQVEALSGVCPHPDIVVIRFPSVAQADGWHRSAAYQALVPLRQSAAEMILTTYRT